jgi:hypothetical protein
MTNVGSHFAVNDTLSASPANLGGSGTGFSVPVSGVSTTGTGMIGLLGNLIGGTGGTSGTYAGVPMTGGSGMNATANITVSGGAVTQVTILNPGIQYQVGDTISAASGSIGSTSGFSIQVESITINNALAGGNVFFYIPNTTTFKQTWQNSTQTVLNTNPVTLDANGCATIYGTGIYRQVLQDSIGNTVWDKLTTDTSAQQNVFWAGIAGGTPNVITLVDPGFNATDGSIINFIALSDNTAATTINPSSFGAIPVVKDTSQGPEALSGGELVANNPISVIYSATENSFHILNPIIVNNTNQCILITAFGGAGNDSTDNTMPLLNAFASMTGNGGCIYFQPGKYLFQSSPTISIPTGIFSLTLRGSGSDNTILTWPNSSGGMVINYGSPSSSVHIRDLTFTTGASSGGNAITLNQSSANSNPATTALSDISNVTIRGDDGYALTDYWTVGVNIANVSNVNLPGVSIFGSSGRLGTGISLVGLPASSTFAVGFNVTSANIGFEQYGILFGSFVQGLQVNSSNLIGNQYGIATLSGETGGLTSALLQGTNFDNIVSDVLFQTSVGGVTFTGNDFFVNNANGVGFLGICQACAFVGNTFLSTVNSSTFGIELTSGADSNIITGNLLQGFTTGIALQAGADNNNVQSNNYAANTSNVGNSGTGNTIGGGSP